jgi:hypothetical protein
MGPQRLAGPLGLLLPLVLGAAGAWAAAAFVPTGPGAVRLALPPRALPTPGEPRVVVTRLVLRPASARGEAAALEVAVANLGGRAAVGVGYVLEDAGQVVAYEEREVLPSGGRDVRLLAWRPAGSEPHRLRLVVGDGNVHWVRRDYAARVLQAPGTGTRRDARRLASAAAAGGILAVDGALLVVRRPRRRGSRGSRPRRRLRDRLRGALEVVPDRPGPA